MTKPAVRVPVDYPLPLDTEARSEVSIALIVSFYVILILLLALGSVWSMLLGSATIPPDHIPMIVSLAGMATLLDLLASWGTWDVHRLIVTKT